MNMKRTAGLGRIICAIAIGRWLVAATVVAASYTNDTDWGGADLTLQAGDVIAGVHTNVGHFSVAAGATATVQPYGPVLSDPVYSNEVVIGYATTNTYGWARIYAVSGTVAGTLSADAAGYPATLGPGKGSYRSGAGYGGNGTYGKAYGSPEAPLDLGSGGGQDDSYKYGGSGGGAILLAAEGALLVPGTLSANGGNGTGRSGAGSGGSLWLRAARIAGSGTVSANGGSGSAFYTTAAGGGRIAFDTPQNAFAGIIRAKRGAGISGWNARNGTFNFKSDPDRDLVVTNDIALPPGTNWVFKSLTVANGTTFEIQSTPGTVAENTATKSPRACAFWATWRSRRGASFPPTARATGFRRGPARERVAAAAAMAVLAATERLEASRMVRRARPTERRTRLIGSAAAAAQAWARGMRAAGR